MSEKEFAESFERGKQKWLKETEGKSMLDLANENDMAGVVAIAEWHKATGQRPLFLPGEEIPDEEDDKENRNL